ncbi:MAG: WecB/TagA/CpsF family glycosyltransferase [Lachnospiraceae bacterium]|nr:WecB/TagA/CpsF family glycosyltransferase [Robinsoniella sp.]MDY3767787.1 WecB/TagA/CpsF family glycosyltransferase [Lachnospiraceae bacterium]
MKERIEVLGCKIDDLSAQEAVEQIECYLQSGMMCSVGMINRKMLMYAAKDEIYRSQIERMDVTVINDREILKAANIENERRKEEVDQDVFLNAFLKDAVRRKRSVAILAELQDERVACEEYLAQRHSDLCIVGSFSIEESQVEDDDSLVNMLNAVTEDILLVMMPCPEQEKFLAVNRGKLGVKVWIGIGTDMMEKYSNDLGKGFFERFIDKTKFKRQVSRYQSEKENQS